MRSVFFFSLSYYLYVQRGESGEKNEGWLNRSLFKNEHSYPALDAPHKKNQMQWNHNHHLADFAFSHSLDWIFNLAKWNETIAYFNELLTSFYGNCVRFSSFRNFIYFFASASNQYYSTNIFPMFFFLTFSFFWRYVLPCTHKIPYQSFQSPVDNEIYS